MEKDAPSGKAASDRKETILYEDAGLSASIAPVENSLEISLEIEEAQVFYSTSANKGVEQKTSVAASISDKPLADYGLLKIMACTCDFVCDAKKADWVTFVQPMSSYESDMDAERHFAHASPKSVATDDLGSVLMNGQDQEECNGETGKMSAVSDAREASLTPLILPVSPLLGCDDHTPRAVPAMTLFHNRPNPHCASQHCGGQLDGTVVARADGDPELDYGCVGRDIEQESEGGMPGQTHGDVIECNVVEANDGRSLSVIQCGKVEVTGEKSDGEIRQGGQVGGKEDQCDYGNVGRDIEQESEGGALGQTDDDDIDCGVDGTNAERIQCVEEVVPGAEVDGALQQGGQEGVEEDQGEADCDEPIRKKSKRMGKGSDKGAMDGRSGSVGSGRQMTQVKPARLTGDSIKENTSVAAEERKQRRKAVMSARWAFGAHEMPNFSMPWPPPRGRMYPYLPVSAMRMDSNY